MQDTLEQTLPVESQAVNQGEDMKSKKKPAGKTGKRYSPEERRAIVEYVQSIGRGGGRAAAEKFDVSALSVSRFLKEAKGMVVSRKPKLSGGSLKAQKLAARPGHKGNRYSSEQKQIMADYVRSVGKGGIIAAAKKFGVSKRSITRFVNESAGKKSVEKERRVVQVSSSKGLRGSGSVSVIREASTKSSSRKKKKKILKGITGLLRSLKILAEGILDEK